MNLNQALCVAAIIATVAIAIKIKEPKTKIYAEDARDFITVKLHKRHEI